MRARATPAACGWRPLGWATLVAMAMSLGLSWSCGARSGRAPQRLRRGSTSSLRQRAVHSLLMLAATIDPGWLAIDAYASGAAQEKGWYVFNQGSWVNAGSPSMGLDDWVELSTW
jgi:hypothetical protein